MSMERFKFASAEQFVLLAQLVTLDNLLEKASRYDDWKQELSESYEDELVHWSKGMQVRYGSYPKSSLLEMVKAADGNAKASTSKADLISELLRVEWQKTETFQAYEEVRKAHNALQDWADELRKLPSLLEATVKEADDLYAQIIKNSPDICHMAHELRFRINNVMAAATLSRLAKEGLRKLEEGKSLSDVVASLAQEASSLIRGITPGSLSINGNGIETAAQIDAAKHLLDSIRYMLPKEQRRFLAY
ncbi:hypothetical protein [Streptomyces atratus]|uniref:hypothetical protein n=1 Tax=Streptomyces atratus TaxID=1893 RepID=UPI003646A1DE